MAIRLTLLCASATASSRIGAFPRPDEPLDEGGVRKAAVCRPGRVGHDLAFSGPSRSASETAAILELPVTIEPDLADRHFGDWSGRPLAEVEQADAAALMLWLADPSRPPPGGESMADLADRVGRWIDRQATGDRDILAISHASVMRAAIAHCLAISFSSVTRIDIAPLATVTLSFNREWRLQELTRYR